MFLLYHSKRCNICGMKFYECYINNLRTTTYSAMLGHRSPPTELEVVDEDASRHHREERGTTGLTVKEEERCPPSTAMPADHHGYRADATRQSCSSSLHQRPPKPWPTQPPCATTTAGCSPCAIALLMPSAPPPRALPAPPYCQGPPTSALVARCCEREALHPLSAEQALLGHVL
jgi:hypothetical protein